MGCIRGAGWLLVLAIVAGCDTRRGVVSVTAAPAAVDHDRVTQVSVISALMQGQYDGVLSLKETLALGDFGLGTLDHLDGELIVLDGRAWQVRGDGTVHEAPPGRSTPFAVVTFFRKDGEIPVPAAGSLEELEAVLNERLAGRNAFYVVRIDGDFARLVVRSVGRQEPPYPPLLAVSKQQYVATHDDVRGTLVAVRCPEWSAGLNVPGWHWHFLSADRKVGGHVLQCRPKSGTAAYQECLTWVIQLDRSRQFQQRDLGHDVRRELEQVERARGAR